MQTLERTLETKPLTAKDKKAIAALVKQSQAIGVVTRSNIVGQNERTATVGKIAKILDFSLFGSFDGEHYQGWNVMTRWLDDNHPGWRGYLINYPDGRIG